MGRGKNPTEQPEVRVRLTDGDGSFLNTLYAKSSEDADQRIAVWRSGYPNLSVERTDRDAR